MKSNIASSENRKVLISNLNHTNPKESDIAKARHQFSHAHIRLLFTATSHHHITSDTVRVVDDVDDDDVSHVR